MQLNGERLLPLPHQHVWNHLSDMHFIVRCVPDVASITEIKENAATVVVRPGFSFVRGELQLALERIIEEPDRSFLLVVRSKGVGSTSVTETRVFVETRDDQTLLRWQSEVKELGGLLKAVPRGLIQGAATKLVGDLMTRVELALVEEFKPKG